MFSRLPKQLSRKWNFIAYLFLKNNSGCLGYNNISSLNPNREFYLANQFYGTGGLLEITPHKSPLPLWKNLFAALHIKPRSIAQTIQGHRQGLSSRSLHSRIIKLWPSLSLIPRSTISACSTPQGGGIGIAAGVDEIGHLEAWGNNVGLNDQNSDSDVQQPLKRP